MQTPVAPLDLDPPIARVPESNFWTLARDEWITPHVFTAKSIVWDTFMFGWPVVREIVGRRHAATVIDVGAFIGDSLWPFYEAGCRCIAFEPQADAFACLRHNCPSAESYCLPVGNGVPVQLQVGEGGNMGARQARVSPVGIQTFRLDDLKLDRCDFLKIDVEGFEPLVLQGAAELLRRCRPVVWIECSERGLKDHGFVPADMLGPLADFYDLENTQPKRVGGDMPYDFLCTPKFQ